LRAGQHHRQECRPAGSWMSSNFECMRRAQKLAGACGAPRTLLPLHAWPAGAPPTRAYDQVGRDKRARTRRTCTMTTVSCRQPQRATSVLSSGGAANTDSLNMIARPGMRVMGCCVCGRPARRLSAPPAAALLSSCHASAEHAGLRRGAACKHVTPLAAHAALERQARPVGYTHHVLIQGTEVGLRRLC